MADDNTDEFIPQDPADKLRMPSNSPFSLPGDDESPATGLEVVLVQAEIDAHIFDLKTLEKNSQKKSIQKLVDLGSPAVEPLTVYLKHPDRWARMMAAEVLGRIHDPKAIPALKEALNDQHQGVRYMTELALKEISNSVNADQGTPIKGKDGQGKPPMPAKVTAKLHPMEGRGKTPVEKNPVPEKPPPQEKPKTAPSQAIVLPEPKIPENMPEIKTLEPRVVEPPVSTPLPSPTPIPVETLIPATSPKPTPVLQTPPEQYPPDDLFPFGAPEIAAVGIQSDAQSMDLPIQPGPAQDENSSCPVCHKEIKADTRVCPHCHAKFDVSLKGFCPNCRKSVEIDPFDQHCPRCGEEVIDRRYEARLVAYGDIKPEPSPVKKPESIPSGPVEGLIPSQAGIQEVSSPPIEYAPEIESIEEFPPIEDPALQAFADRYLIPEFDDTPAVPSPVQNAYMKGDVPADLPFIKYEENSLPLEEGISGLPLADLPPASPLPPTSFTPSEELDNSEPVQKPSDEAQLIRPLFAAATAAAVSSLDEDYSSEPVVPNMRRFAQEGGTPIYVPGQDDSPPESPESIPENTPSRSKQGSAGKKKAEPQKPKPVRKKPETSKPVNEDLHPPKKTEAVFTAEDYYLSGNSLVPPEKPPQAGGKERSDDYDEGQGISPWLIAAPLFLIAAVMIYLLYFRVTGRAAPYLPDLLATEPLPTLTFTPQPTPEPTVVIPAWMDSFAAPALTAVQDKKTDFFDNFSVPDSQWGFKDGNRPALGPVTLENEALLMTILRDYGMARQRKVNFNNFVETFDINFGQNDQSIFELILAGSYGSWGLHLTNSGENWEGTIKQQDPKTGEWSAVQSGSIPADDLLKASLTVIRNADKVAILIDGVPFMYYEDAALPRTMFHDYYFYRGASTGKVQMLLDNIRIWNLDKYLTISS
jgi:hypothetical protein